MIPNKSIAFVIKSLGPSRGGHYYSLLSIAHSLKNDFNIIIINLGDKISPVLYGSNINTVFVKFNGFNFYKAYKMIRNVIKDHKVDVINAFDNQSFSFARLVSYSNRVPLIYTKCGGPNPEHFYFPIPQNLVLFSLENSLYFGKKRKYARTRQELIPNRVLPITEDRIRIGEIRNKYSLSNKLVILRITRIGSKYQLAIKQGVVLTKLLKDNGFDVVFLVLGTLNDDSVLSYLKSFCVLNEVSERVFFETEDYFTKNANELIPFGDLIIGTGRNFMESCFFNKIMLVPYENGEIPLLVNANNFHEVFAKNFSQRTKLCNFKPETNKLDILRILSGSEEYHQSHDWFEKYFSLESARSRYLELFNDVRFTNDLKYWDTIKNILHTMISFKFK